LSKTLTFIRILFDFVLLSSPVLSICAQCARVLRHFAHVKSYFTIQQFCGRHFN